MNFSHAVAQWLAVKKKVVGRVANPGLIAREPHEYPGRPPRDLSHRSQWEFTLQDAARDGLDATRQWQDVLDHPDDQEALDEWNQGWPRWAPNDSDWMLEGLDVQEYDGGKKPKQKNKKKPVAVDSDEDDDWQEE